MLASINIYDQVIEGIEDYAILLLDAEGRIQNWNKGAEKIKGYSAAEIIGKTFQVFYPVEDLSMNRPRILLEQARREGSAREEGWRVRKDGSRFWGSVLITAVRNEDKQVIGYSKVTHDLTDKKRAEEAEKELLRITQQNLDLALTRFKQAESIARLGHWQLDLKTGKADWSDEAFLILGVDPLVVQPSLEAFMARIHPDDVQRVGEIIRDASERIVPFTLSHRIIQPGGKVLNLYGQGRFEFNERREPIRLFGAIFDVSELMEKEARLKASNKELETLIYRISHDLRGPLVSSQGLLQLAQFLVTDQDILFYLNSIDTQLGKQDRTLLMLVKLMEVKSKEPVSEQVELKEVVEKVLAEIGKEAPLTLEVDLDNQLSAPVCADPELLYTILFHLIENALHFRRKVASEHWVKITLGKSEKGEICIEVADNGTGISDQIKDVIYDMFYRGSEESTGAGLGLFLVKTCVEKLGGSISFAPGKTGGTTFHVTIPSGETNAQTPVPFSTSNS